MDIDKLEAGRELDALVAVALFGWEWLESQTRTLDGIPVRRALFAPTDGEWVRINYSERDWKAARPETPRFADWDEVSRPRDSTGKAVGERGVPRYSTDIAAAWLVVEKLRADGWSVNLLIDGDSYGAEAWQWGTAEDIAGRQRSYHETKIDVTENWRDSMPVAVCFVALKAKGAADAE